MQRFVLATGVAFALSGCLSQPMIEPMPTVDATAGCLGAKVKDCLGLFSGRISVADYNRAISQVNEGIKYDVNGRPVSRLGVIAFMRLADTIEDQHLVELQYNNDSIVYKMSVNLSKSPMAAKTTEEYKATKIYTAMIDAFGTTCDITRDPLQTYRFFENLVKPAFSRVKPEAVPDDRIAALSHTESVISPPVPACGHHVTLSWIFGEDWAQRSEFNRYGSYSGFGLDFD